MHYQSNTSVTEGVFAWGFTINNLPSFSTDTMRDDVNLKLKRQQCKYQPNTTSSSLRNNLSKNNNNIHEYGANKRQLKGHLCYMTQIY